MKAATPLPALKSVVDFIASSATEGDLAKIHEAIRVRESALREERAGRVAVGADVEIVDISPKYLNGLTGTVVRIQGARVTVQLDELSTMRLKCEPKSKFPVAPDATSYNLTGLPRASCQVASN